MEVVSWTDKNLRNTYTGFVDSHIALHAHFVGEFLITEQADCVQVQCTNGTLLIELVSANTFCIKINQRM